MSIKQLAMSALRVYIFAPSIPKNDLDIATRILIWGYSCSCWTKAAIFLNSTRFNITQLQSKRIGIFHLVMGWLLLQIKGDYIGSIITKRISKLKTRILVLFCCSIILDFCVTFLLMYQNSVAYKLRGELTKLPQDCMICLQDENNVESFCKNHHSFHASCMEQWYKPFGSFAKCPTCRCELEMQVTITRNFQWIPVYLELLWPTLKIQTESFIIMGVVYVLHKRITDLVKTRGSV